MAAVLVATGCYGDPAEFRPAKGVRDLPSVKAAYRVQQAPDGCDDIGGVVEASSIEDIAVTAANHGGSKFHIINDAGRAVVETETKGGYGYGSFNSNSTSAVVKHHRFIARVYRCE